jgi:bacteriochlorophyll 4-vinyl reductase
MTFQRTHEPGRPGFRADSCDAGTVLARLSGMMSTPKKSSFPPHDARGQTPRRVLVTPELPLALLRSIRTHDQPRELLEDEVLSASLPRRLGLTGVIESQILRLEDANRRGSGIPVDEVTSLLRLLLRRPDAESILREAGAEIAGNQFRRLPPPVRHAVRTLPGMLLNAMLRRAIRRLLRGIVGRGTFQVWGRPPTVRLFDSPTAEADSSGAACELFAGAIEEIGRLYTGQRPELVHSRCDARGDECCEWTLVESTDRHAREPL